MRVITWTSCDFWKCREELPFVCCVKHNRLDKEKRIYSASTQGLRHQPQRSRAILYGAASHGPHQSRE